MSNSAHESQEFSFRLPATAKNPVYLRILATAAIPTGASVFFSEAAIAKGSKLYAGGPTVAIFSGRDPTLENDSWTITVGNDYGGNWQTWYNRVFGMASLELLLPTGGTPTIDDSLITV
jgi:hypothetical protein